MFVVTLKYLKPIEEIEKSLVDHRNFLQKYYDTGDLVCSGPQNPRVGGIILARTASRERLEEILAQDPFQERGLVQSSIVEFSPVKFSAAFEKCL